MSDAKPGQTARQSSANESRTPDADPVMMELLKGSAQATKVPCPTCGSFMPPKAIVCTQCGWDKNTGKTHKTSLVVEKAPNISSAKRSLDLLGWMANIPPFVIFLAAALSAVPMVIGMVQKKEELQYIGFAVWMLLGLVFWITHLVEGFKESSGKGVLLFVLSFIFPLYNLWWIFTQNDNSHLKAGYLGMFLGQIVLIVSVVDMVMKQIPA